MKSEKPTILITNDDGISAPGIWHLWHAMRDRANIIIAAPKEQQSGKGLSITLKSPIRSEVVEWEGALKAWQISGTPADCIKLSLSVLLDKKPDMILSGINQGCNSGRNVLYSGTVGALIEGTYKGIPGIAFSCREYYEPQYHEYESFIPAIVDHFLEHSIPKDTLINVNFPKHARHEITGIRYARHGQSFWVEDHLNTDGNDHHFGAKWSHFEGDEESDVHLLRQGFITASPIRVGELTNHDHLADHKEIFESRLSPLLSRDGKRPSGASPSAEPLQ